MGAWEEVGDTCTVKHSMACDHELASSDAICQCGAEAPPSPATPSPTQAQGCFDTLGWTNGYTDCGDEGNAGGRYCTSTGWTCAGYVARGWCANGAATRGSEFAFGAAFNYPERNCCACGGQATYTTYGSGACRGLHAAHNPRSWYSDAPGFDGGLADCQAFCTASSACKAVEFAAGSTTHCELWTQEPQATNGNTQLICSKKYMP